MITIQPYGDNFSPVIPVDYTEHTAQQPFCANPSCPCHEDQEAIDQVNTYIVDGLMTPKEATDFVFGKTI